MPDNALPSRILLVLGMHRSGSSALTRAISLLGHALPKTLIKDNRSNRRGHWESQPLARLDDAYLAQAGLVWSDWTTGTLGRIRASDRRDFVEDLRALVADEFSSDRPAVIKEPRICRLVPQFREAFEDHLPLQAIIAIRNPLEVIASLVRRNNMTEANAGLLWLRYMLDAVSGSDGLPRAFIAYDHMIDDPIGAIGNVEKALGTSFPVPIDHVADEICGFLSGNLRNHSQSSEDVVHHDLTAGWISDTYAALRVLTRDPTATEPLEIIVKVQGEFDAAEAMLGFIVGTYDAELNELRRRTAALGASVDLKAEQIRLLRESADAGDPQELRHMLTEKESDLAKAMEELRAVRKSPLWKLIGRKARKRAAGKA